MSTTDEPRLRLRPLGRDGALVSALGLGTWAIGGPWVRGWGSQDDVDSVGTIHRAVAAGINWIDTAPVYGRGHSEEVVGRALAGLPAGERPLVFTKCGRIEREDGVHSIGDPDSLRRECETSRRRLGTDRLDLLQLHWPPQDGTLIETAWECLAQLREEGEARAIGLSNVTLDQLQRLEAIAHVDTLQPPLSLVNRGAVADVLPWCAAHGIAVIVYSPMQAGLLSGAFDHARLQALDEDDWRRAAPWFTEPAFTANLALVDRLREIAGGLGATVAELAIAWTLDQPGVTAAIVGGRRPDQVDGWIGAARLVITAEARAAIAAAIAQTGA
jgi:aryl-alcohol dehydrogenase-like predicted oxidoreductase